MLGGRGRHLQKEGRTNANDPFSLERGLQSPDSPPGQPPQHLSTPWPTSSFRMLYSLFRCEIDWSNISYSMETHIILLPLWPYEDGGNEISPSVFTMLAPESQHWNVFEDSYVQKGNGQTDGRPYSNGTELAYSVSAACPTKITSSLNQIYGKDWRSPWKSNTKHLGT